MTTAGSINALLKALKGLMHWAFIAVVHRREAQAETFIRRALGTHHPRFDASI